MKKYSIIIKDTLLNNETKIIEDDNQRAFIARVCSWHETGRSDLGEESDAHDALTDAEISHLLPRLQCGQHIDLSHGITRYTYRFITFNGTLVQD